jgi:hypothetical protein
VGDTGTFFDWTVSNQPPKKTPKKSNETKATHQPLDWSVEKIAATSLHSAKEIDCQINSKFWSFSWELLEFDEPNKRLSSLSSSSSHRLSLNSYWKRLDENQCFRQFISCQKHPTSNANPNQRKEVCSDAPFWTFYPIHAHFRSERSEHSPLQSTCF